MDQKISFSSLKVWYEKNWLPQDMAGDFAN